ETRQKLTFTLVDFSAIDWTDKNEEFRWHGKLYDVSKIEQTKNGFIIYCENDQWEEEFISLFSSWKDQNHPDGKIKFLLQPMCYIEKISIGFFPLTIKQKYGKYFFTGLDTYFQPASPPPDLSSSLS